MNNELTNEPEERPEDDMVNHPKHYADDEAPCECIKVIHYVTKDLAGDVAVGIGNLVKYVWRLGKKSPDTDKKQTIEEKILEDMKKSAWYLEDAIVQMENRIIKNKIKGDKNADN